MDKQITCVEEDCGSEFTFTEGEQEYYQSKDFQEPKRCPDCRAKKKAKNKSF